ncbi:MAG: ATP-binding protein [Paracoccaceae bacterium]|jgi:two-component system nitrogen regulation sensor histidine kinase GlnL|nr:ATP-binding protein [Paracoccaceae bacterium]MDG2453534.1 ATP-binding protein [Paracoccaceae bacterium]
MNVDDLWTSLPVPALLLDVGNRIIAANSTAEDFMNVSAKSLLGTPIWDQVMIDAPIELAFARACSNRTSLHINDVDIGTGARAPVLCNMRIAPLNGSDDQMLVLFAPREITSSMSRNASSVKAARSAIGMAEMLAHEIKNPLAGITGAAQLLAMNLSNGDLEMTDLIVEECRRIVSLLDQVDQFGNLAPPQMDPVNVHDVLDRARRSAAVGFGAHMTLIEDYDPSLPPTMGDTDQLLQVFQNLLKNASEASKGAAGKIRLHTYYDQSLRVRRHDGTQAKLPLQIEIIDDGPGLPPEIESDVFEPFISGRENGTGLGLALVSKIIADHDGWITVDSVPGRTVFRVSLPLVTTIPQGEK